MLREFSSLQWLPWFSWRRIVTLIVVYIILQVVLYKGLHYFLIVKDRPINPYLDWVFYFYFPEKKFLFIYFLLFLGGTWVYFFCADMYLNFWKKQNDNRSK